MSEAAPKPPVNLDVEAHLLGSLLVNNDVMGAVLSARLEPGDFSEPIHQVIFAELVRAIGAGQRVTPITLKQALPDIEIAPELPLSKYLIQLAIDSAPTITVPDYAAHIRDLGLSRTILDSAKALAHAQVDATAPDVALAQLFEQLDAVRLRRAEATSRRTAGTAEQAVKGAVDDMLKIVAGERVPAGAPTHIGNLDAKTDGLKPGELIVVAGRPGMGKTTFGVSVAQQVAMPRMDPKTGEVVIHGVGFFSMEMPEPHIGARMLADIARGRKLIMPYNRILKADFDVATAEKIAIIEREYTKRALKFDYSSSLTLGEIMAKARGMKKAFAREGVPLSLLVFDYLKFIKATDRYKGNRVYEVGEISATLKTLARDLDTCVMLLCQLNRKVEERSDKRPELQDLRESGDLEADADAVWFLYREIYYLAKDPRVNTDPELMAKANHLVHVIEVDLAKQRMGPTGAMRLFCDVATASIRDEDMIAYMPSYTGDPLD